MARRRRYHVPGAFYHVMLRGNDGQSIFFSDEERCRMCLLIQEGVERFGHRIHAFCLMGNHIHLLVQVGDIPLSTIIHNLAFRYSQFINRRHEKIGHLFQGRFKAILLQENTYFLRLIRYIHMNPVRAHIVKKPVVYPWSGHRAYLGHEEFVWLTTHYALAKFEDHLGEARKKYEDYVLRQEPEDGLKELRKGFDDGQILGQDDFVERIRDTLDQFSSKEIPLKVVLEAIYRVYEVDQISLASRSQSNRLSLARGAATTFARKKGISLETMAKAFSRDGSSLGRLERNFSKKYESDIQVRDKYKQFEEMAAHFADLQA